MIFYIPTCLKNRFVIYYPWGDQMELQINCTADGVKTYPLHSHNAYEIIYYIEGSGMLRTDGKNYPFSPGTIIIMPPNKPHGSSSVEVFKNICICWDFDHLLNFSEPVCFVDNEKGEGRTLVDLIYKNRMISGDYLLSLCRAYANFVCQNIDINDDISIAVNRIISEISNNAFDCNLDLSVILENSGYAKDYIRACFKDKTGKTPTEFLTEIRIAFARHLIELYKDALPMSRIAESSGFLDYVYFSKRFKRIVGMSPDAYKKTL